MKGNVQSYPESPDSATPWEALIVGGLRGIAGRLRGSGPLRLSNGDARRFRAMLDAGFSIQVLTPNRETWDAARPALYQALGLECVA